MANGWRKWTPALPSPHFMAFAPLDVWARLLCAPPAWIPLRYWLRLAFNLFTSVIGTCVTLPERLIAAPGLARRYRTSGGALDHEPGSLLVLGYFRSGTTHLHYLLSCDPNAYTCRWYHALAPQGGLGAWWFFRLFLIPFMSSQRPQDDVAYGPEWPGEDDFALNNWSLCSSLPGRAVVPRQVEYYRRFHNLKDLASGDLDRWRRTQWAFLEKLAKRARERRLLLKTPSHTARVDELTCMLGEERVKYIHLSRDPEQVIRSNVFMLQRLQRIYGLQHEQSLDELEAIVTEEYLETERRWLDARERLRSDQWTEMRYADLRADPIGAIRDAYVALDIPWTDEFEERQCTYLASIGDYTPNTYDGWTEERAQRAREATRQLVDAFQLESPARARSSRPVDKNKVTPRRTSLVACVTVVIAILCGIAWLGIAAGLDNRYDWLVWPTGMAVGLTSLWLARRGTLGLGAWSATLTLAVLLAVAYPNSRNTTYRNVDAPEAIHVWTTTRHELTTGPTLFWAFMGMMTAYRFGSRRFVHPP